MTEIAAPVVAGLAKADEQTRNRIEAAVLEFGARDIARRQTVPAMVGLRYLGTQIELRHRPLSPFMRQHSFLGVWVTDDAGCATSESGPSLQFAAAQQFGRFRRIVLQKSVNGRRPPDNRR